jgi:hypothetical protein
MRIVETTVLDRKVVKHGLVALILFSWVVLVIILRLGPSNIIRSMNPLHPYNDQDAALVAKVKRAVELQLPPEQIEQFVGVAATINTWRPEPRYGVDRVNMAADPPEWADPPKIHSAHKVMAWPRPVPPSEVKDPPFVGIMWDENGNETVFAGMLLPY